MTTALLLEPQDLLFCRDGRPIVPGEGAAAGSQLPGPQVVAGALRTALLKSMGKLHSGSADDDAIADVRHLSIRGPLLYARQDITLDDDRRIPAGPILPMPADVVGDKAKHGLPGVPQDRLVPQPNLPGWQAPKDAPQAQALWPCYRYRRPKDPENPSPRPGDGPLPRHWLTWQGFQDWLAGKVPAAAAVLSASDLFKSESRSQVGLTCDGAVAEDGVLFTTNYLRLTANLALYVEVDGAQQALPDEGVLHLGGDRRLARWHTVKPIDWPSNHNQGVAIALTPAIIPQAEGRCPQQWQDHCRGLAVPGCDPLSGWDLQHRRPRPVRWCLHAGSVWHLGDNADHPAAIGLEADIGHGWVVYGALPRATN